MAETVISMEGASAPSFTTEKNPELEALGILSCCFYLPDGRGSRIYAKSRDGRLFISGDTHLKFSNLVDERDKRLEATSVTFDHLKKVLELKQSGAESEAAEYVIKHVGGFTKEIGELTRRVQNPEAVKSVAAARVDFEFVYSAIRLFLDVRGLPGEMVEALRSEPTSEFWLAQNYDELRDMVNYFRRRLGF